MLALFSLGLELDYIPPLEISRQNGIMLTFFLVLVPLEVQSIDLILLVIVWLAHTASGRSRG